MKCTRFAPSPTGLLHLGNIYSAFECERWAKAEGGKLLLRIEDIDFTRCRKVFSQQILADLLWLNIRFDGEISYQQQRLALYEQALRQLIGMHVLYPCFCTRKQIEKTRLTKGVMNDSKLLDDYPETCKTLPLAQREQSMQHKAFSWRLDMHKVREKLGSHLFWLDLEGNKHVFSLTAVGDVIIGRKDIQYSYHLSVVVDDENQGVTHVIRGKDLYDSTPVHILLQQLLGYESPCYNHHKLIVDEKGGKLAKRKQAIALNFFQDAGVSAEDVRKRLGF